MSKVKIEGNASGTGTLTISAPATNTDRSLTLPDGAGEILTDASTLSSSNLSGALPAIDGSALTGIGGGITEIDTYRINGIFYATASAYKDVNNNWERNDVANNKMSYLGTGISESAGIFSYPSTGHYLVYASVGFYGGAVSGDNYFRLSNTTNNGTNWYAAVYSYTDSKNTTDTTRNVSAMMVVDVTDTSNVKTKMEIRSSSSSVFLNYGSDSNFTYIQFIKLADT